MALLPNWDSFTHKRPSAMTDAEGNAFTGLSTIGEGFGVWGSVSSGEATKAAQRGERLDAGFSTTYTGFRVGDIMETRGRKWTITFIHDLRIHDRVGLRITDERPMNL